jgi:hypothetical protein
MDYENLGFLAISKKDNQEAINIFRRALEKKKNANGFLGFGIAHYNLEDYPTARWAFYKGLELEPNNDEIIKYIGLVEGEIKKADVHEQTQHEDRKTVFRSSNDYLEIFHNGNWKKLFIKGINIGLGLPGYFPGEFPIKKGTYLQWFEKISDLGINTVRIYTIHPPSFYEALSQFNQSGKRLYLLQGIWVELPENNNFSDENYIISIKENIKDAIDVVYGNIKITEKPGHAYGVYDTDVSLYTIAFIFGREWESCAVKKYNELRGRRLNDYKGGFISIKEGTPFEVWITQICDILFSFEYEKYKISHPVSVVNWPTLDPLNHPSESKYEEGLLIQGIKIRTDTCNENEDVESLDVAKIKNENGGGFFATYHVYPYYPDFMNNDYLDEKNPYRAYLTELKRYHKSQPILIAEFGVPSSREITHWQKNQWHHGGHNEAAQGEINSELMKSINESGMAGGIVFSWFDEWFKMNWLSSPYEIPAERNPLWFNFQDAEQNYGLLAAYPGYPVKKVNLAGRIDEWNEAITLYEKKEDSMAFKFNDSFDETRAFKRLLSQHDEGFLYLFIETKGKIDFTKASYIIGLDTCRSNTGETLLPFNTNVVCPVGLKFLVHLCCKEKSRILVSQSYNKYLNKHSDHILPSESDQGAWVIMMNLTNPRRISKDGRRFYPSHVFSMSTLRFGSLEQESPCYDSLAVFFFTDNIIELRIPWGLLNFTDPSSKSVIWMDKNNKTQKTEGIKIIAVSYKPEKDCLCAKPTGLKFNITDSFPDSLKPENVAVYSWEGWNIPIYHSYLKKSYYKYKEVLSAIPEEK